MGHYFVMSKRFNKCKASDFGFVSIDSNKAINPKDNSIWIKTNLYDLGWGKENGFYKSPLPGFSTLLDIALYSDNMEDVYGAASIILEKFADELLCQCEFFANDCSKEKEFKTLVELFKLNVPLNRCSVVQKTYEQIQSDSTRWNEISKKAVKSTKDRGLFCVFKQNR